MVDLAVRGRKRHLSRGKSDKGCNSGSRVSTTAVAVTVTYPCRCASRNKSYMSAQAPAFCKGFSHGCSPDDDDGQRSGRSVKKGVPPRIIIAGRPLSAQRIDTEALHWAQDVYAAAPGSTAEIQQSHSWFTVHPTWMAPLAAGSRPRSHGVALAARRIAILTPHAGREFFCLHVVYGGMSAVGRFEAMIWKTKE